MHITYTMEVSGIKRSVFTFTPSSDKKSLNLYSFFYYTRPSIAHPVWEECGSYDPENIDSSSLKKSQVKIPEKITNYLLDKLNGK